MSGQDQSIMTSVSEEVAKEAVSNSSAAQNMASAAEQALMGSSETVKLGLAITAGLAALGFAAWELEEGYFKAKSRKERNRILGLYRDHLAKLGLPAPFIMGPKNSIKVQINCGSQVFKEYRVLPEEEPVLDEYAECILNALDVLERFYNARLKRYYLFGSQGKANDNGSIVICYIAFILSRCLTYQGSKATVELMKALYSFTRKYSGQDESIAHARFEELKPVAQYLNKAVDILEKHRKDRSLGDPIEDLSHISLVTSKNLIRSFGKLINPRTTSWLDSNTYIWKCLDNALIEDLAVGIIKPSRPHEKWGANPSEVKVFASPFKSTLMKTAARYGDVLAGTKSEAPAEKKAVDEIDLASDDFKKGEKGKLRAFAKKCKNFLTVGVDKKGEAIPIEDPKDLKKLKNFLYKFDTLNNEILTIRELSADILKNMKKIGEVYLTDPDHYHCIFAVYLCLLEQTREHAEQLRKEATRDLTNLAPSHEDVALEIIASCHQLEEAIAADVADINATRTKDVYQAELKEIEEEKHELLGKVSAVVAKHGLGEKLKKLNYTFSSSKKNPEPPEEDVAALVKRVREKDPKVDLVYVRLSDLKNYGKKLQALDADKGKVAIDLALELKKMANDYFSKVESGQAVVETFNTFKTDVKNLIVLKNPEMSKHRASWKPILANLLIALSGIGIVILAGQLAYSKIKTGHASFFFAKTKREQLVKKFEELAACLPSPAA